MARCVVWVEGVDFDETLFDTQKLSVIRGASRALEEMPGVDWTFGARRIQPGSRHHRFSITGGLRRRGRGRRRASGRLDDLMAQSCCGPGAGTRRRRATDPNAALKSSTLARRFHGFVEPIGAGEENAVDAALQRARARVRVEQLRDPGVRVVFLPREEVNDRPCESDRVRPAEVRVDGVPKSDGRDFTFRVSGFPRQRRTLAFWPRVAPATLSNSGVSLPPNTPSPTTSTS